MRDACRETIFATRPSVTARQAVAFCLDKLVEDAHHTADDELSPGLSYKDLLGALLLATDAIDELDDAEGEVDELERDLSSLQDEVSTLESEVCEAEHEVDMSPNTIDELEATIADMEDEL